MRNNSVYVIGAGGHAKVVIATLYASGYKCEGVYDDNKQLWGKTILEAPVIGPIAELKDIDSNLAIIGVGDNSARKTISQKFTNINWISLIHPNSCVHESVKIGQGSIVFAGAIIQPDTIVGSHSIINTSASVDHDCYIGDFCHIAPGTHIAGGTQIEENVFLGIGSAVLPSIKIVANTLVGAGTTVIKNIETSGTYIGSPAKKVDA